MDIYDVVGPCEDGKWYAIPTIRNMGYETLGPFESESAAENAKRKIDGLYLMSFVALSLINSRKEEFRMPKITVCEGTKEIPYNVVVPDNGNKIRLEVDLSQFTDPVERAKVMRAVRDGMAEGIKDGVEAIEGELVFI